MNGDVTSASSRKCQHAAEVMSIIHRFLLCYNNIFTFIFDVLLPLWCVMTLL